MTHSCPTRRSSELDGGVMKQVLRHGELRRLEFEADGQVVHLLNGVCVPQFMPDVFLSAFVDLAGVDLVQHVSLHQAEHGGAGVVAQQARSEEHTSELQSLMRISYAVFCLKK